MSDLPDARDGLNRDRLAALRQLGDDALTRHVAEQYARLLAPKDEYGVARLYTETGFIERLKADFDGDFRIKLHLAPPWLASHGPDGRPRKRRLGAWLLPVLRFLAGARGLRGSWLDPFRLSAERQLDRSLLADYEADLDLLIQKLRDDGRRIRGLEQFEMRLAHRDERGLHLLRRDVVFGVDLEAQM